MNVLGNQTALVGSGGKNFKDVVVRLDAQLVTHPELRLRVAAMAVAAMYAPELLAAAIEETKKIIDEIMVTSSR